MPRLTTLIHQKLTPHINPGDIVIDATLGNAYDTCFLANLVGTTGHVYGFDIQKEAITSSKKILLEKDLIQQCSLKLKSHSEIENVIPDRHKNNISTVMFNFGYLPGCDKTITTKADTSLVAVQSAYDILKENGKMSMILYPGHAEGKIESVKLQKWIKQLETKTCKFVTASKKETDPIAFLITKHS